MTHELKARKNKPVKEENPFHPKSAAYKMFEHRYERLEHPSGELHAWHCWCDICDMIKKHAHSLYKIIIVDEPSYPPDRTKDDVYITI